MLLNLCYGFPMIKAVKICDEDVNYDTVMVYGVFFCKKEGFHTEGNVHWGIRIEDELWMYYLREI